MAVPDPVNAREKRKAIELLNKNRLEEARTVYQRLLGRYPKDAEGWLMLAVVEGRAGNPAGARRSLRNALQADPGLGEAWFVRGQLLEKQLRPQVAVKAYRKALTLNPRLAEAHAALGRASMSRSLFQDAIRHYRRALAGVVRPELMLVYGINRLRVQVAYADALRFGGETREALSVLESALNEHPEDPDLLQITGNTYIQLLQIESARHCFRKGLQIDPGHLRLRTSEINLLCLERRFDEALGKIRPLFETETRDFDVAVSFSKLCHLSGECDAAIARLEDLVEAGKLDNREKTVACFELGRLLDAREDYDRAFAWYRYGNESKDIRYDRETADAAVDALIRGYSRESLTAAPRATNNDSRPVFIIGMPRSGSTLVEQILACHPDVLGAGELSEMGYLVRGYRRSRSGTETERLETECTSFTSDALNDLASQYLEHINRLSSGERYVTDKMLNNFFRLGAIALMLPNARIIHCRRDPLDTCLSCYFHNFTSSLPFTYDLENLASFYRNYRRLMAHWKETITLPFLEVDYEALVADQESETRRILDFLDLEWDERCLQFHESDRITVTDSYDQVNKPIYSNSVARWKNYEKYIGPLIGLLEGEADGRH